MEEEFIEMAWGIIRKEGNQWCVYDHTGIKKLGCYTSKKDAVRRLRQIEYFKNHPDK